MKKGNLYKNKEGIVVMCTEFFSSKYFGGVVLYASKQKDINGVCSDYFAKDDFSEYIGDLTLNNIMNER